MSKFSVLKNAACAVATLGLVQVTALSPVYANDDHDHGDDEGWYLGVGAGVEANREFDYTVENSPLADRGGMVSAEEMSIGQRAAIGYRYGNGFRSEIELYYVRYEPEEAVLSHLDIHDPMLAAAVTLEDANNSAMVAGGIDGLALMANVYYDIDTNSIWVPYLGGGAGFTLATLDTRVSILGKEGEGSGTDAVLTFQAMAGVAAKVRDNLRVYGGWRGIWMAHDIEQGQSSGSVIKGSFHGDHNFGHRFEVGIQVGL